MEADQTRGESIGFNRMRQPQLLDLSTVVIEYANALAIIAEPRKGCVPNLQRRHIESRSADLFGRQTPALTDAPEPPARPLRVECDKIDDPVPFPYREDHVHRSFVARFKQMLGERVYHYDPERGIAAQLRNCSCRYSMRVQSVGVLDDAARKALRFGSEVDHAIRHW